jgi:tetratricopeptide (TPR) repeat protein
MSTTLNLADRLLARARRLRSLGRTQDALSLFERLAAFRELPGPVAEETQAHLAELHLHRRHFRRARRHLTAALQHAPDSARYHYLMARAAAGGPDADLRRAAEHYRRSLDAAPDQPHCLCAYGRLALQLGRREEALACLRRAAELAPDDADTVRRAAAGLRRANRADEARALLRAARFRNPRDPRFRRLWDEAQFQELRKEQELARLGETGNDDAGPVLLPFLRLTEAAALNGSAGRKVVRQDAPAPLPPPHGAGTSRRPPQRHAQ